MDKLSFASFCHFCEATVDKTSCFKAKYVDILYGIKSSHFMGILYCVEFFTISNTINDMDCDTDIYKNIYLKCHCRAKISRRSIHSTLCISIKCGLIETRTMLN